MSMCIPTRFYKKYNFANPNQRFCKNLFHWETKITGKNQRDQIWQKSCNIYTQERKNHIQSIKKEKE